MASILAINLKDFYSVEVASCTLRAKTAFAGHEIVVVNLDNIANEYETDYRFDSSILTARAGKDFDADIARRHDEAVEHLDAGGVVIYLLPSRSIVRAVSGDQTNAAPGKVTIWEHSVSAITPFSFQFVDGGGNGSNLECRVAGPFREFFDAMQDLFQYETYLGSLPSGSEKLYFVKGSSRCVGSYTTYGRGHLIVMPGPNFYYDCNPDGEPKGNPWLAYADALRKLRSGLESAPSSIRLPAWAEHVRLPGERDLLIKRASLAAEIGRMQAKASTLDSSLAELTKMKVMLGGFDKALEEVVGKCFTMLGCIVEPGPLARDDLFVRFGKRLATVEVKGLTKSAREQDVRQLMAWVNSYNDGKGKRPKGILVVNGYRSTAPSKRTEPVFPHALLKLATQNEFCLISSTQLLALALDCCGNEDKRKASAMALFDTVGVFDGYGDWVPAVD